MLLFTLLLLSGCCSSRDGGCKGGHCPLPAHLSTSESVPAEVVEP